MKIHSANQTSRNLKSQSGQAVVESILIITMLLGITFLVSSQLRDNDMLNNLVRGPWERLDGMIQNGAWKPARDSYSYNPTSEFRTISLDGEVIR